jgi:cellulose 1,4-beta-cellobiosidase
MKILVTFLVLTNIFSPSWSLTIGTTNQNNLLSYPIEVDGSVINSKLVLDGNWHWLHSQSDMNKNCYPNGWNTEVCPDPKTCWNSCAIEGVPTDQWGGNYGVHVSGDQVTLGYVTRHQYGTNVGSRMYITETTGAKYYGFNMLGR